MRYCDEVLFPFLEAEEEKVVSEETERDEDLRYLMSDVIGADEEEARLLMRETTCGFSRRRAATATRSTVKRA